MKHGRRIVLQGMAGATLGLPFLESFGVEGRGSKALAQASVTDPFAIIVVHGNGVQQREDAGGEPDRFWPSQHGPITDASLSGRAVDELAEHRDRLLIVSGVDTAFRNFGDHGYGGGSLMTATGAVSGGNNRLAGGESIDWRIGRELNAAGREPLNLYAGPSNGYITTNLSYRGSGDRRSPERNPLEAYRNVVGVGGSTNAGGQLIVDRRASINDLVRSQLNRLMNHRRISADDQRRVRQHLEQVRDLEVQVTNAELSPAEVQALEAGESWVNDGSRILEVAALHMKVAALSVVSGASRVAVLQSGAGQDTARYTLNGQRLESYHHISHRARHNTLSYINFPEAEMQHHGLDRLFLANFKTLVDRLVEFGAMDDGVAIWTNNLARGPSHTMTNLPFVMAGSCRGVLRQGEYIDADRVRCNKVWNTIASAVGVRSGSGGPLTDFGDSSLDGGLIDGMLASRPWG